MMNKAIVLMMTATVLFSCEKSKDEPKGRKDIVINKTTTEIVKSDNDFGLSVFREVAAHDPASENIFISPTSIALALAMTYNGAAGETKTSMEMVLRKQGLTAEDINTSYKSLMDALLSVDPKVILEIANSIWYRETFTVLPEFVTTNQQFYNATVTALDFSDPEALDIINGWVSDKTHEKIRTIIDQIPPDAVMYLINAIYFKGAWLYEFDPENTTDGPFYLYDGTSVTVPVMKQTASFNYTNNDLFSMIELPYGRGNYTMLIFLPQSGQSVKDITDAFSTGNWNQWIHDMTAKNVDLFMPKLSFEYKNKLNDELAAMGMGVAFSDGADFSGINGSGGLYISRVLHKSFVEINEEGTEAAAVTAVEIVETAYPGTENIEFNVNRPFIFAIRETSTGAILFIGQVKNPLVRLNESPD